MMGIDTILSKSKEYCMAIHAVIFDLGGVLLNIDWQKYQEDEQRGVWMGALWASYEQLNTRLAQFMSSLRPRYKIATICNGGLREAVNRKFRLNELVDIMLFDGEEGVSKPDVRTYQRALMQLNILPNEAVFVDDKESNIETAKNLGMFVVHFKDTMQAISDIQGILDNQLL